MSTTPTPSDPQFCAHLRTTEKPSPRGLLPTPAPVLERIAREGARFAAMTPRKRQFVRDDYNLSYFFGGQEVAYRFTEQGVEVLAVGEREIEELMRDLSALERLDVIEESIRPW